MGHYIREKRRIPLKNSKFYPTILWSHCSQCHGFRGKARSSFSSDEESPAFDFDTQQVIILEIQSRAMRAKLRSPKDMLAVEGVRWVFSPITGKLFIAPKGMHREGEERDEEGEDEAFFSVKSCFSHCSSEAAWSDIVEFWPRSILEEFKDCEGWPFGLWRKISMLPPLPNSPSDSWTWRRRNMVGKRL